MSTALAEVPRNLATNRDVMQLASRLDKANATASRLRAEVQKVPHQAAMMNTGLTLSGAALAAIADNKIGTIAGQKASTVIGVGSILLGTFLEIPELLPLGGGMLAADVYVLTSSKL